MSEKPTMNNEGPLPVAEREPGRFHFFRSSFLVLTSLVLAGAAFGPLADGATRETYPENFVRDLAASPETAGEGVFVGALGGLRTLTSDIFWLRAYIMWERRDRAACTTYARAAIALAPDNRYLREGYAAWLSYDFPVWTIRSLGGFSSMPEPEQQAVHRRDAKAGIAFLEESLRRDPDHTRYLVIASQVGVIKLKDPDLSADYNRRAAETSSAPIFPASLYANHLVRKGRPAEAREWFSRYSQRLAARLGRAGAVDMLRNFVAMIPEEAPERPILLESLAKLESGKD